MTLLIVAAGGYFGLGVGNVYWNYYQYRDRMQQEARFAASRTDGVIKRRLIMYADSIGLPEGAKHVRVRRQQRHVYIWAEYYENIELPFISKELLLAPHVEWTF
ncbi:MAG: hypothetical protein HYV19_14000 [Gemmatimonadetes bacterium]|nr:hypothetical protein [Gemmatimonadota bacterium]